VRFGFRQGWRREKQVPFGFDCAGFSLRENLASLGMTKPWLGNPTSLGVGQTCAARRNDDPSPRETPFSAERQASPREIWFARNDKLRAESQASGEIKIPILTAKNRG
jgi:hypothetical protein